MAIRPTPSKPDQPAPVLLCIDHLDACAGTGLQTDIQTLSAMHLRVACAVTAVLAVQRGAARIVHTVPPRAIQAQIDAACRQVHPSACCIGTLPTAAAANAVRGRLKRRELSNVVYAPNLPDEVSGPPVSAKRRRAMLAIIPSCELLVLSHAGAKTLVGAEGDATELLRSAGARWVLLLGAPAPGGVRDLLLGGDAQVEMPHRNPPSPAAQNLMLQLVASIAAGHLALGSDVASAVKRARNDAALAMERFREYTLA